MGEERGQVRKRRGTLPGADDLAHASYALCGVGHANAQQRRELAQRRRPAPPWLSKLGATAFDDQQLSSASLVAHLALLHPASSGGLAYSRVHLPERRPEVLVAPLVDCLLPGARPPPLDCLPLPRRVTASILPAARGRSERLGLGVDRLQPRDDGIDSLSPAGFALPSSGRSPLTKSRRSS
jgi:hypothetical protein